MTEPAPSETPAGGDAPPSRARAATLGAVAFVLLAAPFLVFGGMLLNLKARVELACTPGGPCTLFHQGWLTREPVERFTVEELQDVTVERNRTGRRGGDNLYRPVLETPRGKFPLSYKWLEQLADAERTAEAVNRFRAAPLAGGDTGLVVFHDQRRTPGLVGSAFSGVGLVLLGVSGWLGLKARRHRRAERASQLANTPRVYSVSGK
ncbi:hypothetical protein [Hyalangium rubrum]|uniref:DUF3592 domain-containing protein n=1 Tax=Hyalangium rubrum TaxID=3103134 RepID=A0ABU5GZ99_9BACT|nr:hypothetical protein [Hyalangium sp. s54d21]MDY7226505.1 hypothetical protein [Hyalangium sp. s54d21]